MLTSLFIVTLSLTMVSTKNMNVFQIFSAGTAENQEKAQKMATELGPLGVGKMLQGLTSRGCRMLRKSRKRSFFVVEDLVTDFVKNVSEVEIQDFNFLCINQGKYKNEHTSASIVVQYSSKEKGEVTQQFPLLCVHNMWTAVSLQGNPAGDSFDIQTRWDCQMCAPPEIFGSIASATENCIRCPESCSSSRCQVDGECCEVYDLNHMCATKCPKNSHKGVNDQCMCDDGYRKQRGRCRKVTVRCRCENGGTCTKGRSRCICPRGFSGRKCQYCDLSDCLKCKFDKVAHEAICIQKARPCVVRFTKEPPSYTSLNCNPFDGTGYTLQCSIEVPRKYANKVHLTWRFLTARGDGIDLEAPLLAQVISIKEKKINRGENIEISSILTATLDDDVTLFGISLKDSAFEYLRGGSVFCEPTVEDEETLFLPSRFLTMPQDRPPLEPCSHETIYTKDSDKCADFTPDTDSFAYYDYDGNDNNVDEDFIPANDGLGSDSDSSRIEGLRGRGSELKDSIVHSEFHPWIFILGTIGAMLIIIAVVLGVIVSVMQIKKKKKRTLQLSSPNNLNNSGGETRQNPNASSVTVMEPINAIAETDSMISQARKGSYPVRR